MTSQVKVNETFLNSNEEMLDFWLSGPTRCVLFCLLDLILVFSIGNVGYDELL